MLKINEVILASYSIITLLLLAYMMKHPEKVAKVLDKASQMKDMRMQSPLNRSNYWDEGLWNW